MTCGGVVYGEASAAGGSIPAEHAHAIGVHKRARLDCSGSQEKIEAMDRLKRALDPLCLLYQGLVV
ncbi:hypothetical protein HHL24_13825 [Paraburkholderia sp. RP-4-7]|uniref:FAD-binding oxidoreductase/transferase type 4 C-terminal domain-containing protein n=1 Tax=Paraburkholderia polaris TaxID=2728848 RepID=A0A848I964_9BURK|nr:hypothetical protein [Paraburkholderia polaris]